MINCAESAGCSIYEKNIKSLIIENNTIKGVKDSNGVEYFADSVILACGGASYPKTGSDGYGYVLARQAGHTVTKIKPSLVPLESIESYCCDMMGLSLRNIKIDLLDTKNRKDDLFRFWRTFVYPFRTFRTDCSECLIAHKKKWRAEDIRLL